MKHKKQLRTIGSKFTVMFVVMALVLSLGLCAFSGYISWEQYTSFYWQKARAACKLAASFVDGDRIASYLETEEPDDYYRDLEETFRTIKQEQELIYLYIFIPSEDHFTYVLDAILEGEDPSLFSTIGDTYDYTELEYQYLVPDIQAKSASQNKVVVLKNYYGPGVSAWAPIFDSAGNLVAMVEGDMSLDVVVDSITDFLVAAVAVCCTLVLAAAIAMSLITRKIVAKPVAKLTENVLDFASEDTLSFPKGDIQTGDELQTLSEAFGKMADDIGRYTRNLEAVAADKERIATELSLATDIQVSLLPRRFPAFPDRDEFDIYAVMQPAKVVGGDFYDFFLIDSHRLGVVVGGVSGRGIPAALFMVVAKTIIKNQLMSGAPVEESMTVINSRLYESSASNVVVRAFVGILDTRDGHFSYVNAGQEPPLILRKDRTFAFLDGQAMTPLAQTEYVHYRGMELRLRQGDRLVLYSEGATLVKNTDGVPFGPERLRTYLNLKRGSEELQGMVTSLCSELEVYEHGVAREEDVTVLALSYLKGDRAQAELLVEAKEEEFFRVQQFLRRQLEENQLGGVFYAHLSVAVEEAFALVAGRLENRGEILVRCAVEQQSGQVAVSLLYPGPQEDPFAQLTSVQEDAVAFIRRSVDTLQYRYQDGRNGITLQKSAK